MVQLTYAGVMIKTLNNLIRRQLAVYLPDGEAPSTGMQGWVMRYLSEHPQEDVFQRDIEAAFHIRRSTATRLLGTMEEKGLIARCAVPQDARLKKLTLTPRAIAMHEQIYAALSALEARIIRDIPPAELAAFMATAKKMCHNLED